MPPKKKVERAATENISLGPQVRDGQSPHPKPHPENPSFVWEHSKTLTHGPSPIQVNSSSVSPVYSLHLTIPLFTSQISGSFKHIPSNETEEIG